MAASPETFLGYTGWGLKPDETGFQVSLGAFETYVRKF
jgi:hypothetical protein